MTAMEQRDGTKPKSEKKIRGLKLVCMGISASASRHISSIVDPD